MPSLIRCATILGLPPAPLATLDMLYADVQRAQDEVQCADRAITGLPRWHLLPWIVEGQYTGTTVTDGWGCSSYEGNDRTYISRSCLDSR